ncbi:glycine cleavage system aminomethyltransferase GcvT [Fodinicola acaciae]|uniref:glycine cleavage system aminomethyltransferase GcvT n=1 Tax=Fodinicola acaciae TaxID=2681555 RepID=UPI0013D0E8D8|nr:glycine cleavage system aminomethyltransferase GcvT [Fodinicola acaciae]
MTATNGQLRRSPLHARHVEAGAKIADFGGWEMPIEYAGGGVIAEHTAVREAVGVFDVSHLGKATVRGPGAADFVNGCLTADLGKIGPGQAQYTLCCDDPTGGVVDDMIAYLYGPDHVFLVPNAANTAEVVRRLQAAAPSGVDVLDRHEAYGVIAVQGPKSAELLGKLDVPSGHDYMSFVESAVAGAEIVVCRTGYTGEHGYELVIPVEHTVEVWDALLAAGEPLGVRRAGLGARDTLRTEMGYPLHGQDLSLDITPVQGRSAWAVGWDKPAFWGRDVLVAERPAPRRRLTGLKAVGRGIPRAHMQVLAGDTVVGEVTSGTFSPTLKTGIGLALIDTAAGVKAGDEVEVDVRGRRQAMIVTTPPFVPSHVR